MTQKDHLTGKDENSVSFLDEFADRSGFGEKELVGMRATKIRWLVLTLACLSCIGSYFSSALLAALQTKIMALLKINSLHA